MSDVSQGDGWWIASDGRWYAPELHPDYVAPPAPPANPSPPVNPALPASSAPVSTAPAASNRRGVFLGMGALILIVGLGFLIFRLLGGGGGTGASSPEAAVEQFLASLAEGDSVGIAEVFDPDEIEGWAGSFQPASNMLDSSESQTTTPEDQLRDVAQAVLDAFDIEITGPDGQDFSFTSTPLDDNDRLRRVRVDGVDVTLRVSNTQNSAVILSFAGETIGVDLAAADGAKLELRDRSGGLDVRAVMPGEDEVHEFADDLHLELVTVNKDGDWYISVGYSVLEAARNSPNTDLGQPDFGRAYELVASQQGGAETAEEAVRAFFDAAESLNYEAMIQLSDPLSLPYLHDYQPTIDDNVDQRSLREASDELDLQVSVLDLNTSSWNDRTLVTMTEIAGRIAGGSFELDTETWCAEATSGDGERVEGCLEDGISEGLGELGEYDIDPADLLPGDLAMVVVERNGRWFLDPLGTIGFYAHHVAEAALDLDLENTFTNNPVMDLDLLIALEGPIVTAESAASRATPENGSVAGVAIDLSGFEQDDIDNYGDPLRVALARISTDGNSSFIGFDARPAEPTEWAVVYDAADADRSFFPAIVLETGAEVTVELFDPEVETVDGDYNGAIGGDGRPIVLVLDPLESFEFTGPARYETVYGYNDYGVVIGNSTAAYDFGDPGFGLFAVVSGNPGDTFSIRSVEAAEPEYEPAPTPAPFADPRVDLFADTAAIGGFDTFSFDQLGGYFDGCGPDDPDVTTYAFERVAGPGLVLITPFPSQERAQAAFDALTQMSSPCEDFPSLIIDQIEVEPDFDAVTITLSTEDEPDQIFEWYARRGDVIVVATGASYDELLENSAVISSFDG